ncbi:hypothetical protein FRC11_010118 [Ceratobasidium sp. 423]|nr:hypothetical protein FRC11_010118 [Ceratobasidium sp. 423]
MPEWFDNVVCKALGYRELKPWQLDMIMSLCSGKDGFLTVATGQGESIFIQGPIVADLAAGIDSIGVTLIPTKCLADDQARSASAKGIRALALHKDSLREARESSPSRDLFEEVAK